VLSKKIPSKKWDDLGFLEGLEGHQKDNIAQLYENQASYLINEAAVADASGSFETVVFPIIRRVFSKLLANDIVSVQAMNLPIGKLFYFVPKIQERSGANHYQPYGMPGNADAATAGYSGINLYDRFFSLMIQHLQVCSIILKVHILQSHCLHLR